MFSPQGLFILNRQRYIKIIIQQTNIWTFNNCAISQEFTIKKDACYKASFFIRFFPKVPSYFKYSK